MNLVAAGGSHSLALVSPAPVTTTTTYGYDSLYRLTSVNDPNGTTNYSYDPVGNRLSKVLGDTTSYAYDKAERILSAGSTSYTVTANGNVTTRGTDTFAYDQANRLTSATIGGAAWSYTYDVNASLPDVLSDGTYTYVYGVGLAYAADGSGNLQVYHTVGLGSVRAISDNSGNVIQTYQTDAFGTPTRVQGTSAQPFPYTRQRWTIMDSSTCGHGITTRRLGVSCAGNHRSATLCTLSR